jgi:hypothetical protein
MRVRTEVIRTSGAPKRSERNAHGTFLHSRLGRPRRPECRSDALPVNSPAGNGGHTWYSRRVAGARQNKSSYSNHRCNLPRARAKDIASVFVFALILDVIYQLIALHTVYPGEAVLVAIVLAIAPYLLVRSLINCLTRKQRSNYE